MDEIDGRAALFVELNDFFLKLSGGVFKLSRNGPLVGLDEDGFSPCQHGEGLGKKAQTLRRERKVLK